MHFKVLWKQNMIRLWKLYIASFISLKDPNVYSIISVILIKALQRQGVQLKDRTSV